MALALVGSALLILWAWRAYLGGEHSPFSSDIRHYHHAVTRAWWDALAHGRLALWTDHTFFGFPLVADPQVAAFYPATGLVAAWGPHTGYVVFLLLHAWLVAVGMFGWLRAHGRSWAAAFAGGMLVSFCGYFAHETQHPGLFAILCWMPWWLWATRITMQRPGPLRFAAMSLVVAAMLFAGTLQVLFGGLLLYAFYVAGLAWQQYEPSRRAEALRRLVAIACANVLGLALAAIVVLPAAAHLPLTARALGMTYAFAAMGSVHPQDFAGLFVNGLSSFSGVAGDLDYRGISFFIGALTLPLALCGALELPRRFAAALACGTLLLVGTALGRHASLHPWLYEVAPGIIGGLRGMGRALGPLALVIALCAAFGVDRAAAARAPARRRMAWGIAAWLALYGLAVAMAEEPVPAASFGSLGIAGGGLGVVLLAGRFGRALTARLLAGLLVCDLLFFGALSGVLEAQPAPPDDRRFPDAMPKLVALGEADGSRLMLHGFGPLNLPLLNGVDGVGGYNPLVTLQYLDFVQLVSQGRLFPRKPLDRFVSGAKPQRFTSPLFDAASVAFVLSNRPERTRGLSLRERLREGPLAEMGASLYVDPRALPRAYLSFRTLRASSVADLPALVGGPDFDARRTSVVEGEGPQLSGPAEIRAVARGGTRPEHRVFEVEAERPAVLVVTDAWDPGWHASVDGEAAAVFRVNGMFRGVAVPAGARRVEMRFSPWSFRVGAAVSGSAAAGILLILGMAWRQRLPGGRARRREAGDTSR